MIRTLLFVLGGVMLGGIIHIVTVLQVPAYAPQSTWARVAEFAPENQLTTVTSGDQSKLLVPMLDPMMQHAVCRYALDENALRIKAKLPETYWSVALYNRRGENVFSINNRSAGMKDLDMLVLTGGQLAIIRENPPAEFEDLLVIETIDVQGFLLLHVFAEDSSQKPEILAGLKEASCTAQAL